MKTSTDKLSVEEYLVDALKGSVSLGEPRNLASLAKTWRGGSLDSKEQFQEANESEGVVLNEVIYFIPCLGQYGARQSIQYVPSCTSVCKRTECTHCPKSIFTDVSQKDL